MVRKDALDQGVQTDELPDIMAMQFSVPKPYVAPVSRFDPAVLAKEAAAET